MYRYREMLDREEKLGQDTATGLSYGSVKKRDATQRAGIASDGNIIIIIIIIIIIVIIIIPVDSSSSSGGGGGPPQLLQIDRGALDLLVPYLLCPLFGVPPGLYRPHHVVMHHVEDNHGQWDISSTEPYQRDSFLQFLGYWCRFFVGAWLELPLYAARRKRSALSLSTLASELLYWLLGAWLWRRNTVATLWTLVLPFLLSSFLLSFGNWSQHVFIEPSRPDSPYTSAYECLNCPDNQRTYNDGYHIMHHLNSRWHWSELPQRFISQLQQHDDNDALVFHSLGFFDVGLAVFTGHLAYLAKHIVPCGPKQSARSTQQWVDVLRHRLSPVSRVGACAKST
ncbi:hypothetical protein QJQ45_028421 [Haematococcus lacustris]|nr:hypothetical protein QJQ45_028421 [Haematococcus lacustris]